MATAGLGIDVGSRRLHCVLLEASGRVAEACVLDADDLDGVRRLADRAAAVAVDAPAAPSSTPHSSNATLSAKFREARCAEISLGLTRRIWVPWVTPAMPPFPAWMLTGFKLFGALDGHEKVVETYPHAVFLSLAGVPIRPKLTASGIASRVALLEGAGVRESQLAVWSHDAIDAIAAAVVARRVTAGAAIAVSCGHDGSAIWLP